MNNLSSLQMFQCKFPTAGMRRVQRVPAGVVLRGVGGVPTPRVFRTGTLNKLM